MNIFNIITLLGGLAMFLYGMRLMNDGLTSGSSGKLKQIMEKATSNPLKAFFLGMLVTAVIQSSTATIVITSGLVAAGIISLHNSLGIIIGANVGTTVTGQIIRLLDVDNSSVSWLQAFKPSTLAPVALIVGIVLIMGFKFRSSNLIGNISMGFGILFSGLLQMTSAVDTLTETGIFDSLFAGLGENPVLGYLTGAGVAFILQSSSATIGILQAFSMSGMLSFKAVYAVIVGIYLGDCVTTAIVCSIGAREDAKRVGIVNILFNLSETVLVLVFVNLLHSFGLLDGLWNLTVGPGHIANTNTIFNLGCSILLFPMLGVYEKLSRRIVKSRMEVKNKYSDELSALSPAFFKTPAMALSRCYDVLLAMFISARQSIEMAMLLFSDYDQKVADHIMAEEENIDLLADKVSNYMLALSQHIETAAHARILDQYYKVVIEFERLGDHAVNLAEAASELKDDGLKFSDQALYELEVMQDIIERILEYAQRSFERRSTEDAYHIEPLEEVVDDLVNALKEAHIARLQAGECEITSGTYFLNILSDLERISDICSNIGVETIARAKPGLENQIHDYISSLHSGNDEQHNREYEIAHKEFFGRIKAEH